MTFVSLLLPQEQSYTEWTIPLGNGIPIGLHMGNGQYRLGPPKKTFGISPGARITQCHFSGNVLLWRFTAPMFHRQATKLAGTSVV